MKPKLSTGGVAWRVGREREAPPVLHLFLFSTWGCWMLLCFDPEAVGRGHLARAAFSFKLKQSNKHCMESLWVLNACLLIYRGIESFNYGNEKSKQI